ncbi:MAG: hypothetical protein QW520_02760 [Methanomassiliicoccales archaeon]
MRKQLLITVFLAWLVLVSVIDLPQVKAESAAYSWTDHMDYFTFEEMEASGWTVGVPQHTYLNHSCVVLEMTAEPPTYISHRLFPPGIFEWMAEVRGMWIEQFGPGKGAIGINVVTEGHNYGWALDGYYSNFALYRDNSVVMRWGQVVLERYRWYTMTMTMVENVLSLYLDGVLIETYIETDAPSQAIGMDSVSPWLSTTQYDYYHFEEVKKDSASSTWASWRSVVGGPDSDAGFNALATEDGGYLVLGITKPVGSNLNQYDTYLIKYDHSGNVLWAQTYDNGGGDYTYGLTRTSDGGFVVAGASWSSDLQQYRIWLFKTTIDGAMLWSRTLGTGINDVAFSVVQTSDGGFAVTGYRSSSDLYLIKTNDIGIVEWERTFGGAGRDWGKKVIQTSDGGYAISGWTQSFSDTSRANLPKAYLIRTTANGTLLWQRYFGPGSTYAYDVMELTDGGFIVSGHTDGMGSGGNDLYVVRTTTQGEIVWERAYGGQGEELGSSLFKAADGFVLGGSTTSFGLSSIYLVGVDGQGEKAWEASFGMPGLPVSGSVAVQRSDGSYLAVGHTNTYASGSDDVFVMCIRGALGEIPIPSRRDASQQVIGTVGAVVVGSTVGLLAAAAAGSASSYASGSAAGSTHSSATSRWLGKIAAGSKKLLPLDKIEDFVEGYARFQSRAYLMKAESKYRKQLAQHRPPFLMGFSLREIMVVAVASILLGFAYMIAKRKDLLDPNTILVFVLVAGFAILLHDLTHRYVASRYGAVAEYRFWGLGMVLMVITSFFFGLVYAYPAKTVINDPKKLTPKQQAIVFGAGPLVSLGVFSIFLLFIPLGGWFLPIAILACSMNLLSAVYSFMPFEPMDGRQVLKWKKLLWVAIFLPLLAIFFLMSIFVF